MLTSIVLIVVNVLVWLAIQATGTTGPVQQALALLPQSTRWTPTLEVVGVSGGAWWQVLTSAFVHMDVLHLAMNMVALYLLGPAVEQVVGRVRFLAIYLVSALTGSAAVMLLGEPMVQTLGASGAIWGILAALLVIAIRHKGDTRQLWILIGLNVAITVWGMAFISWQAHLGGFVGGLLATGVLAFAPREQRGRWQVAGLLAITALAVVLIVVRAISLSVDYSMML